MTPSVKLGLQIFIQMLLKKKKNKNVKQDIQLRSIQYLATAKDALSKDEGLSSTQCMVK